MGEYLFIQINLTCELQDKEISQEFYIGEKKSSFCFSLIKNAAN